MTKNLFCISALYSLIILKGDAAVADENEYVMEQIKYLVWGGFSDFNEIKFHITDIVENEGIEDTQPYIAAIKNEILKKKKEQDSWPKNTDVDKLNEVFKRLKNEGVLCLHNAGYTMSDGHYDANEAIQNYPKGTFQGYCFYHGQDLERILQGGSLMLAYDHINGDVPEKIDIGNKLKSELEKSGFKVIWNGTTEQRIEVSNIKWQNRGI